MHPDSAQNSKYQVEQGYEFSKIKDVDVEKLSEKIKSKLGNQGPHRNCPILNPNNRSSDPLWKPYFIYSGSQISKNVTSYLEAISELRSEGKFFPLKF